MKTLVMPILLIVAAFTLHLANAKIAQFPDEELAAHTYHAAFEVPHEGTVCTFDFQEINLYSPSRKGPEELVVHCDHVSGQVVLVITFYDADHDEGVMSVNGMEFPLFGGRNEDCDVQSGGDELCTFNYDVTDKLTVGQNSITFTHHATTGYRVTAFHIDAQETQDRSNQAYRFVSKTVPGLIYCQTWSGSTGLAQCEAPWASKDDGQWIHYGKVVPHE